MKKTKSIKYSVDIGLTIPLKAEDKGDATVKAWQLMKTIEKFLSIKKLDYQIFNVKEQ